MSYKGTTCKRLTAKEWDTLCETINRDEFYENYLKNGNAELCKIYNISLNVMYRLIKFFNLKFTAEQLHKRNAIASEQQIFKLYGVKNNFQRKEVREKQKQTNLKRYGAENPFQVEQFKEKIRQTNLRLHGVEYPTQSNIIHGKLQTIYNYKTYVFDSLPELAVWIYAEDHNINIVREPCKIPYVFEGVTHYYFPDFLYNGKLLEVKGDQFFDDSTGKMICRYDHSRDAIYEAKHQCMLKNNVTIWRPAQYKFALDYLLETYTLNYDVKLTKNKTKISLVKKDN